MNMQEQLYFMKAIDELNSNLPEFHPIGMTTKSVDYCSLRLLQ